jgi:CrcB protein
MGLAFNRRSADGSCEERASPLSTLIAVALASAAGGLSRYGLGKLIAESSTSAFPWETFTINISGSFVIGFLFILFEETSVSPVLRTAILIGFLGSYTTFSTLSLESFRLLEDGAVALALVNLVGSIATGLVAVYAGIVLARTLT